MTIGISGIVIAVRTPDLEKLTAVNIPLSVIWFGMLGAVLCSLQGIIQHGDDFDPSFNYWHVARPLVGAIVGLMSVPAPRSSGYPGRLHSAVEGDRPGNCWTDSVSRRSVHRRLP